MKALSAVFAFKIVATVVFWCLPLLVLPGTVLEAAGLPPQESYLFPRLLGWAYLALCVGYGFGLQASLRGERAPGPIWVGIVSNGGACAWLAYFGATGAWSDWGPLLTFVAWASVAATFLITVGLYVYGVRSPYGASEARRIGSRAG